MKLLKTYKYEWIDELVDFRDLDHFEFNWVFFQALKSKDKQLIYTCKHWYKKRNWPILTLKDFDME
ncbi:MAG: hypothetical protein LBP70_00715 [Mycoplasmataceae bacterium]|jgi:hypothetical protein|nr:hypothetical protein [Mycoplasmataceae bacterium]